MVCGDVDVEYYMFLILCSALYDIEVSIVTFMKLTVAVSFGKVTGRDSRSCAVVLCLEVGLKFKCAIRFATYLVLKRLETA
jgi:hypothetical protein